MVSNYTQFKYWIFSNEAELNKLREEANRKFIESNYDINADEELIEEQYLTPLEEHKLYFHYSKILEEFCHDFQPPMPNYVLGTAMSYFKRFYLHNSVMDYHPRYVTYTCVYLACKVEEFNVSIQQFVANISNTKHERYLIGGPIEHNSENDSFDRLEELTSIIISFEMLLMHQLRYHLTVHNPYRPMEGFFIDLRAQCGVYPENLRPLTDKFLHKALFTDACLLFAPSQIALAAVMYAVGKAKIDIKNYVNEKLFPPTKDLVPNCDELIARVYEIIGKSEKKAPRDEIQRIENKLRQCQNLENDPRSNEYKKRMSDELNDDDKEPVVKKLRHSEDDD